MFPLLCPLSQSDGACIAEGEGADWGLKDSGVERTGGLPMRRVFSPPPQLRDLCASVFHSWEHRETIPPADIPSPRPRSGKHRDTEDTENQRAKRETESDRPRTEGRRGKRNECFRPSALSHNRMERALRRVPLLACPAVPWNGPGPICGALACSVGRHVDSEL
jgi:hypothetical protein